jgi:nucleoside phosphorylase
MQKITLIHTALFPEAKPIIECLKLQCIQTKPYKIYQRDDIVLIVSGMGCEKALHVEDVFKRYEVKKAINIGIAGCKDKDIEIGTLICTTHDIAGMRRENLTSVDAPCSDRTLLRTTLADMEAETFLHVAQQHLHVEDIYIFKIVSDYLDTTIPKKEFVWKIIEKNLSSILRALDLKS